MSSEAREVPDEAAPLAVAPNSDEQDRGSSGALGDSPLITLVVLVRNELPYLSEWFEWHMRQGFDHFIVIDNESEDGIVEFLDSLIRSGHVNYIHQRTVDNLQQIAYRAALRHPAVGEVAVFIDADEFLVCRTDSPRTRLGELFSDPTVSAVRLNWRVRHAAEEAELQTAGDLHRRFRLGHWHPCVKTASRVSHVVRQDIHAAHVLGRQIDGDGKEASYIDAEGVEVQFITPYSRVVSEPNMWVDHFMHLSPSEFLRKKALRGSAGRGSRSYVKAFPATPGAAQIDTSDEWTKPASFALPGAHDLRSPASRLFASRQRTIWVEEMPVAMPRLEVEELSLVLAACKGNYLEYGAGGSTLLALRLVGGDVVSVESSLEWKLRVLSCGALRQERPFEVLLANVGRVGAWGYPLTRGISGKSYFDAPLLAGKTEFLENVELCLVDGRFRIASALAAVMNCPRLHTLLVDDYLDRPHYHILGDTLGPPKIVGRLAVFDLSTRVFDRDAVVKIQADNERESR